MLNKDKSTLQDFNKSTQLEWLETNGLGGWSGSSLIGCNTRRYHGLLVAATIPPTVRMSLLSKLDETIILNNTRYELGCNQYGSNTIHPEGYRFLLSFTKGIMPQWIYELDGIQLRKSIAMLHGENTVLLQYEVLEAKDTFQLELLPLISARNCHSLGKATDDINPNAQFENGIFQIQPFKNTPTLYISIPGASFQYQPRWFYNFTYAIEKSRGQDFEEDLFNPGSFQVLLKKGITLGVIISTLIPIGKNARYLLETEILRRQVMVQDQPSEGLQRQLVMAADQFIVKREPNLKTVIAGYHWFTDWGRDTMISLPGLCLPNGRFEDARKIFSAFGKSVNQGMLPNRFPDNNAPAEYNTVDGTLWYFVAIYKYFQYRQDMVFVLNELLPVLKEIISWHIKGTRYNIHMEPGGLLYAGEKGQQLTWMDAKIADWVVTPRMGKPVEIQALWYNALCIFSKFLALNKEGEEADKVKKLALQTKESFQNLFWYEPGNYLYDVIDENNIPDPTLRPNQIFAISLPFQLIEGKKAEAILRIVEEKLYTPVGLRSLTPDDMHYQGKYEGDARKRDSSYHQGTVWSWLLGPYVDAVMKLDGENGRQKAIEIIEAFKFHLSEACVGSISEIFDGDVPHDPKGCVAQAWGVAEIARIIKEYELLGNSTASFG